MGEFNILVVDDQEVEAQTFAQLISSRVGLRCFAVSTPEAAVEVAQANPITVFVLDERMPAMDGTRLFRQLAPLAPGARALMLTQQNSEDAVARAMELGYSLRLRKSDIDALPETVLRFHAQALAERAIRSQVGSDLVTVRHYFRRSKLIRVLSDEVLDNRFVDDSEWTPLMDINAGERRAVTIEKSNREAFQVETQTAKELSSQLGAEGKYGIQLKSALESRLSTTARAAKEREQTVSSRLEESISLDAPTDPTVTHISSKYFEYAPVYVRSRMTIGAYCYTCKTEKTSVALLRYDTGLMKIRVTEFYSNGDQRTGEHGLRWR